VERGINAGEGGGGPRGVEEHKIVLYGHLVCVGPGEDVQGERVQRRERVKELREGGKEPNG
jgi:hypothetical protein